MVARNWEEVKSWEDCLTKGDIDIIKKVILPSSKRCPHLGFAGGIFPYCTKNVSSEPASKPEGPHDEVYKNAVGVLEAQMYCINNFEVCMRK